MRSKFLHHGCRDDLHLFSGGSGVCHERRLAVVVELTNRFEDVRQGAVTAALEMRDALAAYADAHRVDGTPSYAFRIGLSTGPVVVGPGDRQILAIERLQQFLNRRRVVIEADEDEAMTRRAGDAR